MSEINEWEQRYLTTPPDQLPWNAGKPDLDLVRLVRSGRIPTGQALDVGTGPGHDAVFLIQEGFNVIGLDISPSAVKLARQNASAAGLFGFFQQGDVRRIPVEDRWVDFINDRGCFHVLEAADRPLAVAEYQRVLKKGGLLLVKVASDKDTIAGGPYKFTRPEFEALFRDPFKTLEFWETVFDGPFKRNSYAMLMEKK